MNTNLSNHSNNEYPTIISFAAGDDYYHDKARELASACESLGLNHSIDHFDDLGGLDWGQICRFKVQFYKRKMQELDRPIIWIDADTKLLKRPEMFRNSKVDFGAMLRSGYLTKFDPYVHTRQWSPAMFFFGNTPLTKKFLDHLCEVERKSPDNITDDFVLQEAWASFNEEMTISLIPTKFQARSESDVTEDSWILHGHSGNVGEFIGKVLQHDSIRNKGGILTEIAADMMKKKKYSLSESLLLAASQYGFDSVNHAKRMAETLRLLGRPNEAKIAIQSFSENNPNDIEGKIIYGKQLMRDSSFIESEKLLKEAEASGDLKFSGLATSLLFDLQQEVKTKDLGLLPKDRTRVWWMKQPYPGNLGDILNPYVIEKVTGIPPRFAPQGKGLLAIGSVIKFAQDGCDVWGTGTPRMSDKLNPNAKYHAVRGPLTRELVLQSGGECPEVYGDPALLMPLFYNPPVVKKHKLGIIRHVRQRTLGKLGSDVRDLNLLRVGYEEIESFIEELLECEMVISTSLHGIILAHAYGIPARWAEFSDTNLKIQGDGTKYLDYLRSVKLADQIPLDLSQFEILDSSLTKYIDQNCEIVFDANALLAAFPGVQKLR